jgi:hypothetical protein
LFLSFFGFYSPVVVKDRWWLGLGSFIHIVGFLFIGMTGILYAFLGFQSNSQAVSLMIGGYALILTLALPAYGVGKVVRRGTLENISLIPSIRKKNQKLALLFAGVAFILTTIAVIACSFLCSTYRPALCSLGVLLGVGLAGLYFAITFAAFVFLVLSFREHIQSLLGEFSNQHSPNQSSLFELDAFPEEIHTEFFDLTKKHATISNFISDISELFHFPLTFGLLIGVIGSLITLAAILFGFKNPNWAFQLMIGPVVWLIGFDMFSKYRFCR